MTLFASTWITSTMTKPIVAEGKVSKTTISRNLYVDNGRNDDDLDFDIDLRLAWIVDDVDVKASLLVLLV